MPRPKEQERDYTTVSIPLSLINRIDEYVKRKDAIYKSRVDFTLDAVRKLLDKFGLLTPVPVLEHFNLDEDGVKIHDRTIHEYVNVAFKPNGIWCDYCETNDCRHIQFALSVPAIQKVIRKRIQNGWDLPDV